MDRPQWQFRNEIFYLEKHGHFVWNQEKTRADIVYRGKVVGYYETPEQLREEKINEILK
jgi:hypothetical protein